MYEEDFVENIKPVEFDLLGRKFLLRPISTLNNFENISNSLNVGNSVDPMNKPLKMILDLVACIIDCPYESKAGVAWKDLQDVNQKVTIIGALNRSIAGAINDKLAELEKPFKVILKKSQSESISEQV